MCTPRSVSCIVPVGFDAVRLGMFAHDRQPFDHGHPLPLPNLRLDGVGIGRARVRAHEANRRPGAGHDQLRRCRRPSAT